MTERKRRTPSPSGRHVTPRRKISATLQQFVAMDRYIENDADLAGVSWGQWALGVLLAKVKYKAELEGRQLAELRAALASQKARAARARRNVR